MPKLVKANSIQTDDWAILAEGISEEAIDAGPCLIPLASLDEFAHKLDETTGVYLDADADIAELSPYLSQLSVIACKFEAFADGRSFSQARSLRDALEYKGELRAVGAFIQDQLHYLHRCGFDCFSMPDDVDEASALQSLADFSESYQAACDIAEPLFRRRA
jgi:uncharacterized protein (DUF934 family)